MNLPVNIAAYIVFVLSLYISQRWYDLLTKIGLSRGSQLIGVLVFAYLFMLIAQVIRDLRRGKENRDVVRRGFYFSLFVGCSWAFLQYVGSTREAPPIVFFYVLAVFYGLALGLLSMIVSNTIHRFIAKT